MAYGCKIKFVLTWETNALPEGQYFGDPLALCLYAVFGLESMDLLDTSKEERQNKNYCHANIFCLLIFLCGCLNLNPK